MKFLRLIVAITLVSLTPLALSQPMDEPINICETGPLIKQYGGTEWYVYSCSDDRSLLVVASPDNPTSKPYAFFVSPEEGVTQLNGDSELTGSVLLTHNILSALTPAEIMSLIHGTKK